MRLYYYTSDIYGLAAIKRKQLKISRFNDLNDPFEMAALRFQSDSDHAYLSNYKKHLERTFGLVCLSSTPNEMLMWSHYAKHHTGMVLGFELDAISTEQWLKEDKETFNLRSRPIEVTYSLNRIVDYSTFVSVTNAIISGLLLTKSKSWEYEKEYRLILPLENQTDHLSQSDDGKLLFFNFEGYLKLTEVLLGARSIFRPFKVKQMLDEAHFKDVEVVEMVLARETFEIIRRN